MPSTARHKLDTTSGIYMLSEMRRLVGKCIQSPAKKRIAQVPDTSTLSATRVQIIKQLAARTLSFSEEQHYPLISEALKKLGNSVLPGNDSISKLHISHAPAPRKTVHWSTDTKVCGPI